MFLNRPCQKCILIGKGSTRWVGPISKRPIIRKKFHGVVFFSTQILIPTRRLNRFSKAWPILLFIFSLRFKKTIYIIGTFLQGTIKLIIASSDYKDFDAPLIITLYDYDRHFRRVNRFVRRKWNFGIRVIHKRRHHKGVKEELILGHLSL